MSDMTPRTMIRFSESKGRQTRHCNEQGCSKHTKGGKPFCSNHVEENPYVKGIRIVINERKREMEAVSKRGSIAIDINGSNAREILQFIIVHGKCTINRLAKDMRRDLFITRQYVNVLKREHRVMFDKTARGTLVIRPL